MASDARPLSVIAGSDSRGPSPALCFLLQKHEFLSVTMPRHTHAQGPVPKPKRVGRNPLLPPNSRPVGQPRPRSLVCSPRHVPKCDWHRVEAMLHRMTPQQDSPRLSAPLGMITSAYFFVCGERYSQHIKEESQTKWPQASLEGLWEKGQPSYQWPQPWQLEAANIVFFIPFI